MESEVWPRMLHEARKMGVPVVVVNARVSDRSFARAMKVRRLWGSVLRKVTLWLAQSEEDARRLVAMGATAEAVRVGGNLKYDVRVAEISPIAERIGQLRGASRVYVAGSTVEGEEELLLAAWPRVLRGAPDLVLVIAPRHPERFAQVREMVSSSGYELILGSQISAFAGPLKGGMMVLLDSIGDLATVYSVAQGAFVGGSLVSKGGHNPLEAARFGVPVMMGESYENFRSMVEGMKQAWAIGLAKPDELAWRIINQVRYGQEWGMRGKEFAERQTGATKRAVEAIVGLVQP
jgi:3-deoxy-D-manno-octulosonic-acid transferase